MKKRRLSERSASYPTKTVQLFRIADWQCAIPGNVPVAGDVLLMERSVTYMKKIGIRILTLVLFLFFVLAPTTALAQVKSAMSQVTTPTEYQQVGEQWMDRRMGTAAADAMEARMAAAMGDEYVRQMQETMGRIIVDGRDTAGFSMPMFGGKGASPMMGFGWGYGMWWGWMVIGGAVLLGLLVWAIILLVRRREHEPMSPMPMCMPMGSMGQPHGYAGDRAQQILKERYAKGEINKEQFEQMKRDLQA
jgi:putative membrane protein